MATFGNTNIESSSGQLSGNILGAVATSGDAGEIASITAHLTPSGTRAVKFALYNAGTDALIAQTEEINISSTGWHTANFSSPPSVSASTSYYILAWADGSFQCTIARASESNAGRFRGLTYTANFPDPSGTSNNNFRYSIYATYAEVGGGDEGAETAPVDIELSTPSVSGSYAADIEAAANPLFLDLGIPIITAEYTQANEGEVTPNQITITVTSTTATHSTSINVGLSPVTVQCTIPSVTASYEGVFNAVVSACAVSVNVAQPMATYHVSAVVYPVTVEYTIPSVAATTPDIANAEVQPVLVEFNLIEAGLSFSINAGLSPVLIEYVAISVAGTVAGYAWRHEPKVSSEWNLKAKIPQSGDEEYVLTPDGEQILLGEGENEVLIYQEAYSNWSSETKVSSEWNLKAKI